MCLPVVVVVVLAISEYVYRDRRSYDLHTHIDQWHLDAQAVGTRLVDGPIDGVEGLRVSRCKCWPERKRIANGDAEGLGTDQGTALDADCVHDLGGAALSRVGGVVGSVERLAGWGDDVFVLEMVNEGCALYCSEFCLPTNPSQYTLAPAPAHFLPASWSSPPSRVMGRFLKYSSFGPPGGP